MLYPIKVVDIELTEPIQSIDGLNGYMGLQGLVRWHGVPLGYIHAPVSLGSCTASTLGRIILEQHSWNIVNQVLLNGLRSSASFQDLDLEDLMNLPYTKEIEELPLVTIAVCTRDRPNDIRLCLESIIRTDYPAVDLLVVDNAPRTDATRDLIESEFTQARYVREPRPGLDWARNRAIQEAKGEIIAFTDDDVVVDHGWIESIAQTFVESPDIKAMTGLVVPYELETISQVLFEQQGGFGKGFKKRLYRNKENGHLSMGLLATGNMGTGANMAFRRSIFNEIGCFDPALDVGTVTNGAGDLEMFYRVLKSGNLLVYEPKALVRHRHRRSYAELRKQITNNGSVISYFTCAGLSYPKDIMRFLVLTYLWIKSHHIANLARSFLHPTQYPIDLVICELKGCFQGVPRYLKSKRIARAIALKYPHEKLTLDTSIRGTIRPQGVISSKDRRTGVLRIDLAHPVIPSKALDQYSCIQVFVELNGSTIGSYCIDNTLCKLNSSLLYESMVDNIGLRLVNPSHSISDELRWSQLLSVVSQYLLQTNASRTFRELYEPLPDSISVSIVIGTYDRPTDLQDCLQSLSRQQTKRKVEIIVVDNNPTSNVTPSIVCRFPGVHLISEPRQGVAYARNAGIIASIGEIIITVDDDVTMDSDWLEKLIAPFSRADVMGVTGNVLPNSLDTYSQRMFEKYGGLGRGFVPFEVSSQWFERSWMHAVPTWELGGTANSAFRACIFKNRRIGLMHETLGPGMPSGVGEDIYLFYKILKAGHTMVYQSEAQVWHKHRRDIKSLKRQIYNYSKGFVSYQLTTLILDRDLRSLVNLFIYLPLHHLKRCYYYFKGTESYPIGFTLLEIAGNLAGPWSLWRSQLRVNRMGTSIRFPQSSFSSLSSSLLSIENEAQESLHQYDS